MKMLFLQLKAHCILLPLGLTASFSTVNTGMNYTDQVNFIMLQKTLQMQIFSKYLETKSTENNIRHSNTSVLNKNQQILMIWTIQHCLENFKSTLEKYSRLDIFDLLIKVTSQLKPSVKKRFSMKKDCRNKKI